jgi:hypothetical protein
MTVHKGKGGKTRVIPIINDEYLNAWCELTTDGCTEGASSR